MGITLTEEGFYRFSHLNLGDSLHILLGVLFEFEQGLWDYSPTFYYHQGRLCKEKYELADPAGLEILGNIRTLDDLVTNFPMMYEREYGATAAKAFPISREVMEHAINEGFIHIY